MRLPPSPILISGLGTIGYSTVRISWPDYNFFTPVPTLDLAPTRLAIFIWHLRHIEGIAMAQLNPLNNAYRADLLESLAAIYFKLSTGYGGFSRPGHQQQKEEFRAQAHELVRTGNIAPYRNMINNELSRILGAQAVHYRIMRKDRRLFGTYLGFERSGLIIWED